MRILRRVIFPIVWMVIFALIAAALVKLAFFDGLQEQGEAPVPGGSIQLPVVEPVRQTVTNTVELQGTVQSDAATPVRVSAAGKVVHLFVAEGAAVQAGDRLFQVRAEVIPQTQPVPEQEPEAEAPAPPAPQYTFNDVLAPVAGTLESLTVLLNQEVSVGETAGSIAPGTFSITGTLTTAAQFRLLGRPATAVGTVKNGPAPFACPNVQLSNKATATTPDAAPGGADQGAPADGAGQVRCAVPADVGVFAGLGATITLTAGEAKDVLTLPLTAVKGSVQKGVVWLAAEDGAGDATEQEVELGLNDGEKVEIVSGLAEGQRVLQFVPGVEAEQPEPGMGSMAVEGG